MDDKQFAEFLEFRCVQTPCSRCRGLGGYTYGSTTTWQGGWGGAATTWGVCDSCWGSGDANHHWQDLRKLQQGEEARVIMRAAKLLSDAVGADWEGTRPAIVYIKDHLAKIIKQRKDLPPYTRELVHTLVHRLAEFAEGKSLPW